jgi:hypothetical protein
MKHRIQFLRRRRGPTGELRPIWITETGEGTDVGIGANGDIWVIGTDRAIYKWTGSDWDGPVQIDGGANRIAVDQTGNPWVINGPGDVYQRMGGVSGSWQQVPRPWYRTAGDIGVGPDGTVWVSGGFPDGYTISRWVAGLFWARVPGAALNISVGPNGPWITNRSYVIWNWS